MLITLRPLVILRLFETRCYNSRPITEIKRFKRTGGPMAEMMGTAKYETPVQATPRGMSEDWLAVCIGLLVFVLSLGILFGADLLGWAVTTSVWMVHAKALAPVSKSYAKLPPMISLLATYGFLLVILLAGGRAMRANMKRFAVGVTAIFAISYAC